MFRKSFRKSPRPLRPLFYRLNQFLLRLQAAITRYNHHSQLRTRTSPSNLPLVRSASRHPAGTQSKRFTPIEIKAYLQGVPQTDLTRARIIANQFQVGRLSELLNRPIPRRFNGRERLYERLSLVIVRYAQGVSPAVLADSLSCFYTSDDIEEAIDYVSTLVAHSLNKAKNFSFL